MPTTTVITGATSGIGKETARALAKQGHTLYLLVRNVKKGNRVRQEILNETADANIHIIHCDVSDLQSVRQAASELTGHLTEINVLINNAGSAFTNRILSADGYEMTFALNHLGHFLLTILLLPQLKTGKARVINVSSEGHKNAKPDLDDIQLEHNYGAFKAYCLSKLYNIWFTQSLAEKYKADGITAYAVHPGVVDTDIWKKVKGALRLLFWVLKLFMRSAAKGAETSVYLATAKGIEPQSGLYFKDKKPADVSAAAHDAAGREKLWEISAQLCK